MALDAHLLLSHYLHKDLCQLTWPCHSNFKHQRWLHMAGYKPDWEPPSGCSTPGIHLTSAIITSRCVPTVFTSAWVTLLITLV